MKCPNEFILSQYADGELPESENSQLASHIEACRACRELVADLRAENRLLVSSLQGIDLCESGQEAAQPEQSVLMSKSRMGAIAFGVVVLLRLGIGLIENVDIPPVLQWMHPLSWSGLLNWLVSGFFYISEEGGGVMTSLVRGAGFAVLGFLILGISIAVTRRAMRTRAILGLISLMLLFVVPGYSLDVRKPDKGRGSVMVAAGETVDDTLIVFGDSVDINGTVTGDLIAFARRVNIQGTVQGNIFGFGAKLDFTGNVDGDIFAFAQTILADGRIGKNLWGFAQTLTVGRNIKLDNDAMLFGTNLYINGDVGRDITAFSASLDVGSKIGRDLSSSGGYIAVHAPSVIGRNLNIKVSDKKQVHIDSGVTIGGKKNVEIEKPPASKYATFSFYGKEALGIVAKFIMGLLLFLIFPKAGRPSLSSVRALFTSGGIGFLVAVATPIAAIILAITLIGIPIGLVAIGLWLLGLYLAKIIIAKCIGNAILGAKADRLSTTALALIIGLVIVIVAVNLPYIGSILNFVLILIGVGSLAKALYRSPAPVVAPQD
jgi:hypothetical protein